MNKILKLCLLAVLTIGYTFDVQAQLPTDGILFSEPQNDKMIDTLSKALYYDLEIDGIYYNILSLDDLTLRAVGMVDGTSTRLVVPNAVNYCGRTFAVTEVAFLWWYDGQYIEELELPHFLDSLLIWSCNVSELRIDAKSVNGFRNCPNLKRINISPYTETIWGNTFQNCQLDRLILEDGSNELKLINANTYRIDTLYCGRPINREGYRVVIEQQITFGPCVDKVFCRTSSYYDSINIRKVVIPYYLSSITWNNTLPLSFDELYVENPSIHPRYPNLKVLYSNSNNNSCYNNIQTERFIIGPNSGHYGENIKVVGDNAEIRICNSNPPEYPTTFTNQTYLNTPLLIPRGSFQAYQQADGWKNFFNIEEYDYNPDEYVRYAIAFINKTPRYGTVEGHGFYHYGDSVTMKAIPFEGYRFVGWREGDLFGEFVSFETDYGFSVEENRILCAVFASINDVYIWADVENGSVQGVGYYHLGDTVTLHAYPSNQYLQFRGWKENGVIVDQYHEYSFTADRDRVLHGSYCNPNVLVQVNVSPNPNCGYIQGQGYYCNGEIVTLKAFSLINGYTFQNWTKDDVVVCTENIYTFSIDEYDYHTITANFGGMGIAEDEKLDVTATAINGMIYVEGADDLSDIMVYNVQGQLIYKGLEKRIRIPNSGLYIVVVEDKTIKVIVE